MSYRTEQSYVAWVRRFVLFHGKRHPRELGAAEVAGFLTHLAVEHDVSASTQNQALSALLFLYRHVLERELTGLDTVARAARRRPLPVVLGRGEVRALLARLEGSHRLQAMLLYGAGLRLRECLALRVKDVDFARQQLLVRQGKGRRDRAVPLARRAAKPLARQIEQVRALHRNDVAVGAGTGSFRPHASPPTRAAAPACVGTSTPPRFSVR